MFSITSVYVLNKVLFQHIMYSIKNLICCLLDLACCFPFRVYFVCYYYLVHHRLFHPIPCFFFFFKQLTMEYKNSTMVTRICIKTHHHGDSYHGNLALFIYYCFYIVYLSFLFQPLFDSLLLLEQRHIYIY